MLKMDNRMIMYLLQVNSTLVMRSEEKGEGGRRLSGVAYIWIQHYCKIQVGKYSQFKRFNNTLITV